MPVELAGPTDMGDVSYVVATIHPVLDVGTMCGGHTIEMTAASITPAADQCVVDGAMALAMTAVDVWTDASLLAEVRGDFDRRS